MLEILYATAMVSIIFGIYWALEFPKYLKQSLLFKDKGKIGTLVSFVVWIYFLIPALTIFFLITTIFC